MEFEIGTEKDFPHPTNPEIVLTLRRPTEIELMQHFEQMSKYTVPTAVQRADGTLVYNKDNTVQVHELQNVPTETFIDLILQCLKKWQGMKSKGELLPINRETVGLFWRKKLNFKAPHPKAGQAIPDSNEKYPETIEKTYWGHVVDILTDDKNFEPDPSEATSV